MNMKFLTELIAEIGAVKPEEFVDGSTEVKEGDRELGVLSDELKAYFTVWQRRVDALDAKCKQSDDRIEMMQGTPVEEISAEDLDFAAAHALEHEEVGAVKKLFWIEVRRMVGGKLADAEQIGICKGWKVVVPAPDAREVLAKELTRLLIARTGRGPGGGLVVAD